MTILLATSTLGHVAERVGVIAAALAAALALLGAARPALSRPRALAMLAALILTPVLLLASIWHSPQLRPVHHHPLLAVVGAALALTLVGALAMLFWRRPPLVAIATVAVLPFRLPISAGGQTSNLLIPLYAVLAAGVLARSAALLRGDSLEEPPAAKLEWGLMGLVVLYAIQASYSSDFTKALQQLVFFYIPFALLLVELRTLRWERRLVLACLGVLAALAVIFVGIGFVEYARRELLLNPKVISANMVEPYFRVNSLFFDPNIYGRFLALVMLALSAALLWAPRRRELGVAAALLVLLWGGLMTSISQSSIVALLLGLAVLAAVRWNVRQTLELVAVLAVAAAVFLAFAGGAVHFNFGSGRSANNSTSGRYTLVKDGVALFGDRPLQGFGAGSFALEYRRHRKASNDSAVSASHTTPITIAAEQGVLGLGLYLLLVVACLQRLFAGNLRGSPARAALAACFAALLLHTLLYADFLEDPLTWTLLGVGTGLWWSWRRAASAPAAAR